MVSVPLKRLVELSGYDKTRWRFEDGWLVLEAFLGGGARLGLR